jgi:hypothetical protein
LHSKDNAAARRRLRKRIIDTLRKPTTMPTKLAKEFDLVSITSQKALEARRAKLKERGVFFIRCSD